MVQVYTSNTKKNNYFQLGLKEASLIMMPRTIYYSNMKITIGKQPVTMECSQNIKYHYA